MLLCRCRLVSFERVRSAIRGGARSVDEVRRACDAGSKCGWCHTEIAALIERAADSVSIPARSPAT